MPARNTIAIFILLVIDTVLISLTAVAERCFECCMALVNFYHSYLFIWYVTQEYLRYMSQELEKKHIRWILTPWKLMAAFSFIFTEVRAVPELLLGAYGSQGPWGTIEPYWSCPVSPLSPGDRFSSGLGTQSWPELRCGHVYLWPGLLDGPQSCVQSYLLPLSAGWTLEVPGYFIWTEATGEIHCCDLRAQTLWGCHSACAGSPVLPVWSTHGTDLLPLLMQRLCLCPVRNPQWEIQSNHLEHLKWTGGL